MAIIITLDVILAVRKMRLNDLAERVGLTAQNLSVLKTGRAKGLRFTTLDAICRALDCQPGDILKYKPDLPGAPTAEISGPTLNPKS
jgi:putative transcriptional regulator